MSVTTVILVCLLLLILVGVGVGFRLLAPSESDDRFSVLSNAASMPQMDPGRRPISDKAKSVNVDDMITRGGDGSSVKKKDDPEVRYFQAGIFGAEDKAKFKRTNVLCLVGYPLLCVTGAFALAGLDPVWLGVSSALGFLFGRASEDSRLKSRIKSRNAFIGYYLPLVIEQISIGVSSGLDVGPCLAYVVDMADQRGSHNPVTELLAHVMKLMKAGMSLDESLVEVGSISGHPSLKNSFMFLAQCSRYGGEVSKQLRELGNAVTLERQIEIETIINGLPNKATGALAVVFAGVFFMLMTTLFARIVSSFSTF